MFTGALLATLRARQYRTPGGPGRPPVLLLSSLMHGLQAEAPRFTERLGKPPQTPVIQTFGEVLPLALYRP